MGFQVETDVSKVTHIVMLRNSAYGTCLEMGTVLEVDSWKKSTRIETHGHCYTKETEESCGYVFYIYDRGSFENYFDIGFCRFELKNRSSHEVRFNHPPSFHRSDRDI